MITGGRGPDVPHSPERRGSSQTKKRSLGDVATPEYRQADASRRAGRLVSTSHSVVGRPSGSTVSVETRELSGAWDAGHHPCSGGVSQGGQGDIARCAMALVKGPTWRLNGQSQTCGLGSSEGIDNTSAHHERIIRPSGFGSCPGKCRLLCCRWLCWARRRTGVIYMTDEARPDLGSKTAGCGAFLPAAYGTHRQIFPSEIWWVLGNLLPTPPAN